MKKWNTIAFLDDDITKKQSMGIKIIGKSADALEFMNNYEIIVGIGDNKARKKIQIHLESIGANMPVLIHPNAVVSDEVEIGAGTVIMAGTVINCSTKIKKGCIINTGATVDHDNLIEDFVHISPGCHLAGNVKLGQGCWLGIGSSVSNNISITKDSIVGAGAIVVKDIIESGTYVGVPAKKVICRCK